MDKLFNELAIRVIDGDGFIFNPYVPGDRIECTIRLLQLFNGRIIYQIDLQSLNPLKLELWRSRLGKDEIFDFKGTSNGGHHLHVSHITYQSTLTEFSGYLHRPGVIELLSPTDGGESFQNVICEVTNFRLYWTTQFESNLSEADLRIYRVPHHKKIRKLTSSLKATGVFSQIAIEFVESKTEEDARNFIAILCNLLSFTQRAHVWSVSQHWQDEDGNVMKSRFEEPVFYHYQSSPPLIPGESIADFVKMTMDHVVQMHQDWNLGEAMDYYIQSMSLNSAWSKSICFFTALETLKAAFTQQEGNRGHGRYVSRNQFRKKGIVKQVLDILYDNFKEFRILLDESIEGMSPEQIDKKNYEKQTLRSKVEDLNRPAYKLVLTGMFQSLNVAVEEDTLDHLIRLRNQIIHAGTPDYEKGPWSHPTEAFKWACRFGGLVEKVILVILGYEGDFTPYDQSVSTFDEEE